MGLGSVLVILRYKYIVPLGHLQTFTQRKILNHFNNISIYVFSVSIIRTYL